MKPLGTILFCALLSLAAAQVEKLPPPLPVDPTPLEELISAEERASLEQAHTPAKQVETYLDISDRYLRAALTAIELGDHRSSERELDVYKKILAKYSDIAFSLGSERRKIAKKIEQRLYKQMKMLERIRRRFPPERIAFADAALEQAKRTHIRALNEALAAGEVLKYEDSEGRRRHRPPAQFFSSGGALAASAQMPGDYLTEEEDEQVRKAQAIDDRIKVFVRIADRRLAALSTVEDRKKAQEEERQWGSLSKLSRAELLDHYARAIEEAMAKLEDAHERNPRGSALKKALTILRDATEKHLQILRAFQAQGEEESVALRRAIDQAGIANEGARRALSE
jgi:hypothetical protein